MELAISYLNKFPTVRVGRVAVLKYSTGKRWEALSKMSSLGAVGIWQAYVRKNVWSDPGSVILRILPLDNTCRSYSEP